jgi:hypothetical protein
VANRRPLTIGSQPEADTELVRRLKQALVADMTANRQPPPKTVPAFAMAYDKLTGLVRIAHARQFDVDVQIVYVRPCDLKGQLVKIMELEIAMEAQLTAAYGRAMGGHDPVGFDD